MLGFEAELDRRILNGKKTYTGDTKLAVCADGAFAIVTDYKSAAEAKPVGQARSVNYSNIELVSGAVNQLAAGGPMGQVWQAMKGFAEACYRINAVTSLVDVLNDAGVSYLLTEQSADATIHMSNAFTRKNVGYKVNDRGVNSLFVHYTAGFPVQRLSEAIDWIKQQTRPGAQAGRYYPISNADRAARAASAAGELYRRWTGYRAVVHDQQEATALSGFIALLYTQLAAWVDHSFDSDGQVKNKTVAVCRVPLRRVAEALPANAQQFLREQAWVDVFTENEVGDMNKPTVQEFVTARATAAAQHITEIQQAKNDADQLLADLTNQITQRQLQLDQLNLLRQTQQDVNAIQITARQRDQAMTELYELNTKAAKPRDLIADYQNHVAARDVWQHLDGNVPAEVTNLNAERINGTFPWSVIDHAIAPALEGRMLAADLTAGTPTSLFAATAKQQIGPDGNPWRELEPGTTSDLGGDDSVIDIGEFLRSALLAPGEPAIGPTLVFGGMHEVERPDQYRGWNGYDYQLIPLELRSIGAQRVTWDQVSDKLTALIDFTATLTGGKPPEQVPVIEIDMQQDDQQANAPVVVNLPGNTGEPPTKKRKIEKTL